MHQRARHRSPSYNSVTLKTALAYATEHGGEAAAWRGSGGGKRWQAVAQRVNAGG